MAEKKVVDTFTVINKQGLHTRPSTEIVKCATAFRSRVMLDHKGVCVNAKSLLGILMLSAGEGAEVTIEAVGEDAEAVVRAIQELANHQFYVSY